MFIKGDRYCPWMRRGKYKTWSTSARSPVCQRSGGGIRPGNEQMGAVWLVELWTILWMPAGHHGMSNLLSLSCMTPTTSSYLRSFPGLSNCRRRYWFPATAKLQTLHTFLLPPGGEVLSLHSNIEDGLLRTSCPPVRCVDFFESIVSWRFACSSESF
jgi:hypothetical protein